jgi:hypothetical protein
MGKSLGRVGGEESKTLDLRLRPASMRVRRRLALVFRFPSHNLGVWDSEDLPHKRIEARRCFRAVNVFRFRLHAFIMARRQGQHQKSQRDYFYYPSIQWCGTLKS